MRLELFRSTALTRYVALGQEEVSVVQDGSDVSLSHAGRRMQLETSPRAGTLRVWKFGLHFDPFGLGNYLRRPQMSQVGVSNASWSWITCRCSIEG